MSHIPYLDESYETPTRIGRSRLPDEPNPTGEDAGL